MQEIENQMEFVPFKYQNEDLESQTSYSMQPCQNLQQQLMALQSTYSQQHNNNNTVLFNNFPEFPQNFTSGNNFNCIQSQQFFQSPTFSLEPKNTQQPQKQEEHNYSINSTLISRKQSQQSQKCDLPSQFQRFQSQKSQKSIRKDSELDLDLCSMKSLKSFKSNNFNFQLSNTNNNNQNNNIEKMDFKIDFNHCLEILNNQNQNNESTKNQYLNNNNQDNSNENSNNINNENSSNNNNFDINNDQSDEINTQALNKKQQSQFKNANKFFISNFLNYIQASDISDEMKQYIQKIKNTAKQKRKTDLYTLVHYRLIFLKLSEGNFNQMNPQDIAYHYNIFGLQNTRPRDWSEEDLEKVNQIKEIFCQLGKDYFQQEDRCEIFQKIITKDWDKTRKDGYLKWISRIFKKISEMEKFLYVYRI